MELKYIETKENTTIADPRHTRKVYAIEGCTVEVN